MTDLERLWIDCVDALRSQISEATWRMWFAGVQPVAMDNERLVLAVSTPMVRDHLEGRYIELIEKTVADTLGAPYDVVLEVRSPEPGLAPGGPAE
ncbi:MAG TPA: DnaA N-terminal domain-containing protein, partial [Acidimicrobiales bacterium]